MAPPSTILIVDDDPDIVKFLKDFLESKQYIILSAYSGEQGLNYVHTEQPDLVLLDVVMPGMSGYDVCRQIRIHPLTTLLPVVMMTGIHPEERIKGIQVGADEFLTKPINREELFARVRSLLRIKELHDVVQAQATQLAKWNKELKVKLEHEAKLAEVTRMLGDIGHEVKNSLMPVLSGVELLQEELDELFHCLPAPVMEKAGASQKMCREIIEMVTRSAQRIQDQVREIADCVKGLTSPLQLAPCHLAKVVETVFKTLQVLADKKGVRLQTVDLESLPQIQADEGRLFKVFYNLVNNAMAEMLQGGTVTIRGAEDLLQTGLKVDVIDNGRGMPEEVRQSLFSERVISRKAGGTGLGTKIVKDVVDVHGGHISVDSEVGVGTTFHLSFPYSPPTR
ncbi:MAG: hybrid sensor histidine kinase/response regulator [Nitrospirota bacterium]|nr:hybrid sensor histidine kinase/response regulator [Nitrospirota bacterium]